MSSYFSGEVAEVESPSGDFSERLESYAQEHAREEQIRSGGGLIPQSTPRQSHQGSGGGAMPAYDYPETREQVHAAIQRLGEWTNLFKHFAGFLIHGAGSRSQPKPEAEKIALAWVWSLKALNYELHKLEEFTRVARDRFLNGDADKEEFQKRLWERIHRYRHICPSNIMSVSLLANETVNFFLKIIKQKEEASRTEQQPVSIQYGGPPSGAASSPTASSISAYTTSSMGAADNHHQQQQVVPAKRTPRPRMDAASLTNQIYDYFFKTVSQLVPSPSATNATTKQVMAVIEKTGVYYTTILGWFLLDQEYNPNDDKLKYLSPILEAYLRPHKDLLPGFCTLETTVKLIISMCLNAQQNDDFWNLEQYKNSVAINSFRSAVESLFKVVLPPAPVKKQEPPEPPPDHSSQPAQYQLPQENRYHEHQQQQHQHHGRRPHHEHSRRHSQSSSTASTSQAGLPSAYQQPSFDMSLSAGDSSHHMGGGNESESMSSSFMSPPSSSSHRTSQGGGASSYPVPGREWERRPPRDARQVDFNHGDETHLVRLPQHPLNAQKPLNGEPGDFLKVTVYLETYGEGLQHSGFYQLGAATTQSSMFFIAIYDPKEIKEQVGEAMGFIFPRDEESKLQFRHPADGGRVRVVDPKAALSEFVKHLQRELTRTDFDGVVLIFMYQEHLSAMVKAMNSVTSRKLRNDLGVIKGYGCLESSVRNNYLENLDYDTPEPRISLDLARELVLYRSSSSGQGADDKSLALWKILNAMQEHFRIDEIFHDLQSCQSSFGTYLGRIEELQDLKYFIDHHLKSTDEELILRGMFDIFPNTYEEEKFARFLNRPKIVASLYVEILVACGMTRAQLFELDRANFFLLIKNDITKRLPKQIFKVVSQLDSCIGATNTWILREEKQRRKSTDTGLMDMDIDSETEDVSMAPPLPPHKEPSHLSHRPPLPSATEIPDEFSPLFEYLADFISKQHHPETGRLIARDSVLQMTSEMINVWISAGYSYPKLQHSIYKCQTLPRDTYLPDFIAILEMHSSKFPPNWKGFGLNFLVDKTITFFKDAFSLSNSPHSGSGPISRGISEQPDSHGNPSSRSSRRERSFDYERRRPDSRVLGGGGSGGESEWRGDRYRDSSTADLRRDSSDRENSTSSSRYKRDRREESASERYRESSSSRSHRDRSSYYESDHHHHHHRYSDRESSSSRRRSSPPTSERYSEGSSRYHRESGSRDRYYNSGGGGRSSYGGGRERSPRDRSSEREKIRSHPYRGASAASDLDPVHSSSVSIRSQLPPSADPRESNRSRSRDRELRSSSRAKSPENLLPISSLAESRASSSSKADLRELQDSLGMGSVTRLFPEPKLRALLDFKTAFPQEFATLEIFVDLAKEEPDFQASFCDVNSKIIFMSILDIMDKERMSLQVMYDNMKGSRAPESTKNGILDKLFGKSQRSKKGGNRDFDFYRNVCDQLLDFWNANSEKSVEEFKKEMEDLKRKRKATSKQTQGHGERKGKRRRLGEDSDDLEEEEASVVLTPAEILAQLNSFRSKIFNDYLNGQVCDKSEFESLHQYIFFHSALRNTDKIPVRLSQAVNDIIRHISSNCDGVTDSELKASVKQMKADNKKQSDLHEYFKKVLKIADGVEELPESCQPIAGLLLGVITGYYEQEVNCIPFTDVIKTQINLPKDETNGLQGLAEYLSRCVSQELLLMIDSEEVTGFSVQSVNFGIFTALSLKITNFLADIGFDMYAAIECILKGRFSAYLKTMLKENSSNFPEKLPLDCYAKLVGHWLDCFLRNVTPSRLPASAMIRKALKLRICVLIKTSELLPVEIRHSTEIKIELPISVMEEIQSNCLELGVTSGIKREEPTPDPNPEPRLKSEAKSEKSEPHPKEYDLRGDETFLKAPGFAMICDDLYMTPHGKKFGKLVLCGYPPIRFKSKMNVEILPEFQAQFQCSFQPLDSGALHPNFLIPVTMTNLTDRNVFISKRSLAAKVVLASSPPDPAEVLPPMLPNLHVLKLLRHYVTFCGTVQEVKDNGDCFTLTNGFNVDIQKDCKTTALIHRTNRLARPDYYSVRCLIFFLQNFTSQSEYESYLDAAIQESEFVRFQDAEPLWHFFTGFKSSAICIRNSFSEAVVRKRQYDKLTMESLDTAEKQDMIKLHEQEPFEAFEERVEEVVDKITDQLEVEEEKARTMLNTLHEILQKHLNYDPKRLKAHCITSSFKRSMFERSVMKKIRSVYRDDPDLFGEIKPVSGHSCLEFAGLPKDLRHCQGLLVLISVFETYFPGTSGKDLRQKIKEVVKKFQQNRTMELKLDYSAEIQDAVRDIAQAQQPPESVIVDEDKIQIYLGCTKKMISYLVVRNCDSKETLGHRQQLIEARSQYLPEYELDLNTPTKLGLAFKICLEFTLKKFPAWPVKELTILSDYLDVKELRQHIDLVLHNAGMEEISASVLIHCSSSPATALCARDSNMIPYTSGLENISKVLTILLTSLCGGTIQRLRKQTQNWKQKHRKRRRILRLADEESTLLAISNLNQGREAPFYAPSDALDPYPKQMPTQQPPGWQQHSSDEDDEQDAGGNSAADLRHGYRSILKHLAKYFTDVQELHPEDAREKAEGICVGLSEAGIGIKDLTREVKAMADEGVAEEEFGVGLMDYLKEANLDPTVITRTKYASEICGYISAKLERQRRKRSCLEPQEQDGSDEDDGEPFQLGESDESDSDSVEYLGSPREEDLGIGGRRDWYGNAEEEGAEAESERESCWRQPTEEARYNLDLKKSFLPLQLFLRRRLTKLQLPQSQATSFLACCMISGLSMEKMRKLFEDISASPTFYPGKFTSTIHDRMIRFKSQFPKKIDLELLVNMTEAFFETAADSKQELFSGRDHDLSNKNLLCQTSDEALRRESYSELETFYKDVLENCFDETPEKAIEAAEACVDAWRISGISCRDLETISAAAVVNKECLGQFVSRAKRMLEAMSCFLSPSVNASMLIAVTLMYAKAKRALKDHCCSLANRKVEGGDLGTLKKPVVAHILEEGKPGESDELKIEAQFDKIAASIGRVFDVESLVSVLEKQIILGSSGIPDSVKKAAFKLALASHFRLLAEGKPALLILEEIIVFSEKMSEARKNLAAGEKADDTKEKEDEEDIDMEDGEVLTDDEDPEKEANNEKVKKKENRLAFEVDSTGDPSITVESKVDSSTFLKNIYDRGLRYELGDSHLVIGNHRFAKDAMSNFLQSSENGDQVQYYPMMSVLVFVDHLKEPHNSYLKLAESSHPDLVTVDRKDRIPLKLFFEENESPPADTDTLTPVTILSQHQLYQELAEPAFQLIAEIQDDLSQVQAPECPDKESQELFENYFFSVYRAGMKCQLPGWLEVSRLAAEEQVKCWASLESVEIADIHTLVKMLLQDSEGAVSRYRYNSVFEILLDSLIGSWRGIPPALLLSPFVRITIEFCRTILEARPPSSVETGGAIIEEMNADDLEKKRQELKENLGMGLEEVSSEEEDETLNTPAPTKNSEAEFEDFSDDDIEYEPAAGGEEFEEEDVKTDIKMADLGEHVSDIEAFENYEASLQNNSMRKETVPTSGGPRSPDPAVDASAGDLDGEPVSDSSDLGKSKSLLGEPVSSADEEGFDTKMDTAAGVDSHKKGTSHQVDHPIKMEEAPASPTNDSKTFQDAPASPTNKKGTFQDAPASPTNDRGVFEDTPASPTNNQRTFQDAPASPTNEKETFQDAPASPMNNKATFQDTPASPSNEKEEFQDAPTSPVNKKTSFQDAPASPTNNKEVFQDTPASPVNNQASFQDTPASPANEKETFQHTPASPMNNKDAFQDAPASPDIADSPAKEEATNKS